MEDKCPFCGAKNDDGLYYECLTTLEITDYDETIVYDRSHQCYGNQLAAQAALLAECREVVRNVFFSHCLCLPEIGYICQPHKVAALLARLEAVKGKS